MQLMGALNIFLGGDSKIPKETMSELFHNLSMQALNKSNVCVLIKLNSISLPVKDIN